MPLKLTRTKIIYSGLIACLLSSCTHPPYNNFKPRNFVARGAVIGATMGTAVGAAATGTVPGALAGTAIGGTVGAILGSGTNPRHRIIRNLNKCDIQFVQYGDTMTLIIPTDKYFMFESPRLNEIRYVGLNHIIDLLRLYPDNPIYVAGFTDNVGTEYRKDRLSQAQAETMMTFLWANGIQATRLHPEGYGDKNSVGDNAFIHGSAFNRRIEIQWFIGRTPQKCCVMKPNRINFAMK
ncbi:C-OmpA-like family protein CmpA [Legionella saoudiensis]|uniref:C-OmpA-like family protein CmpA n=1 Tax=Legionella saoudiensis TaxID=1750561 RepID=UPI000731DCF5|nr:C-OmpA-like family protein CmpA [Legionella saoudiensis]